MIIASPNAGIDLGLIEFEQLVLSTEHPRLTVSSFSLGSPNSLPSISGFPAMLEDIHLINIDDYKSVLEIRARLQLTKGQIQGITVDSGLKIHTTFETEEQGQPWKLNKIEVKDVALAVNNGVFQFNGDLTFYRNNPDYGHGFNGRISAWFQPGIEVEAAALFGNNGEFDFWYVDAFASLPPSTQIMPGLSVRGFGGGASYHLRRMGNNPSGKRCK